MVVNGWAGMVSSDAASVGVLTGVVAASAGNALALDAVGREAPIACCAVAANALVSEEPTAD